MSLQSLYQSFLADPSAAALAEAASFNYITTLTTINESAAIVKHLATQNKQLKKKQEKVIGCIESSDAICLDVETTLEFISNGGAYLPGLDDNFVVNRVVTFPIVHIVHFTGDKKIQQVRLYWDQGALLKLVDVIGARARNWPIRDGRDQARLIATSVAGTLKASANGAEPHETSPTRSTNPGEAIITSRNQSPGKKSNVTGDPNTSLAPLGSRDINQETSRPAAITPRVSAKPPPRDYHDLFVVQGSDFGAPETPRADTPKGGAGKNYQPSRLFDDDIPQPGTPGSPQQSPDMFRKPHPKKYDHFEFGDGSDAQEQEQQEQPKSMPTHPKTKHQSQWDFEDFVTPEKVPQTRRGQDVHRFGWSGDVGANVGSSVNQPKVAHPRRDAQMNFEFKDDGTPAGDRPSLGHPRGGRSHQNGLGLYQNNLYGGDMGSPEKKAAHPLRTVTNIQDRKKDFEPHFTMSDSPASRDHGNDDNRPISDNRQKAVKMMDAHWGSYDQSPGQPKQSTKENYSIDSNSSTMNTGIKTAGDGMGGKKGGPGKSWGIGDDSDGEGAGGVNQVKFMAEKRQQAPKETSFWDF